jgi:hypothetical protein
MREREAGGVVAAGEVVAGLGCERIPGQLRNPQERGWPPAWQACIGLGWDGNRSERADVNVKLVSIARYAQGQPFPACTSVEPSQ